MAIQRDEVLYIAELAKLHLEAHEIDDFAHQLSAILDYAQQINQLDTEHISPTASVVPRQTVMAEDEPRPTP